MKKSIFRLGATTITMLSFALLFKIQHWPGAGILLLLTLAVLVPVTAFLTASYLAKEEDEER